MHYVVMKDGEKVRSCSTLLQAKAVIRHIKGGIVRTCGKEISVPSTNWLTMPENPELRPKPYISIV